MAMVAAEIEAALNSEDMFWCRHYRNPCKLSRTACTRRFEQARMAVKNRQLNVFYQGALSIDLSQCKGCEEGKRNRAMLQHRDRSGGPEKPDRRKRKIPNAYKICHKCGQVRHKKSFHKNKTTPDGLQRTCKFCMAEYQKRRKQNGDTHQNNAQAI